MRAEYIREQSSPRSTLNAMYWDWEEEKEEA